MNKFIKLTNDADNHHKGNIIYINVDHISNIYEGVSNNDGVKTFIYSGFSGITWEVEESPKDIIEKINNL